MPSHSPGFGPLNCKMNFHAKCCLGKVTRYQTRDEDVSNVSAGGQFELMPIVDATRLSSIRIFHYYKNSNYCRAEMHFAGENYALGLGH